MRRWSLVLWSCAAWTGSAHAQQFYTPLPQAIIYDPTQGEDPHLFNLNPASNPTVGSKGGAYGIRHFRDTSFTANDDTKTLTHAIAKEDIYGLGIMADLGAGMSAGLAADRVYTRSDISRTTATRPVLDLMTQQSVSARVSIDLATGLRAGFIMRYVSVNGDLAGTWNGSGSIYRVRYHGNLVGNGAGAQFTSGALTLGASYMPPVRGKSEIVFEERIIADPGMAQAGLSWKAGPHMIGAGLRRWIHRRDERAATVTSQDGQRTLTLNGLDPEKNIFPITAYHLGFEWNVNQGNSLRASVVKKDSDYITDLTTAPTTTDGYESMSELNYHLAIRIIRGQHDVIVGGMRYSRQKTLTSLSGTSNAGAIYSAHGSAMFASWGAKL